MSYILDALRKADAERERGSVPGIHAQPLAAALPSDAASRIGAGLADGTRRWLLAGAAAGLALLLAVALARALMSPADSDPAPPDTRPGPPVSQSPADPSPPSTDAGPVPALPPPGSPGGLAQRGIAAPAASPPAPVDPLSGGRLAMPPQHLVAAPAGTPLQTAPPGHPLLPRLLPPPAAELQAAPQPSSRAAAASAGSARALAGAAIEPTIPGRAGKAPVDASAAPGAIPRPADATAAQAPPDNNRIYQSRELPEEIRRELPVLTVGGATYSENAASRMLIINGQVFHENDQLAPDLVLERIQLRSAVLRYRGLRYGIAY